MAMHLICTAAKNEAVFLAIAGGNTTAALQLQEGIFNKVPKPIKIFIVLTQKFATFSRRDDRNCSSLLEGCNQRIPIISLIFQKIFGI